MLPATLAGIGATAIVLGIATVSPLGAIITLGVFLIIAAVIVSVDWSAW